MFVFDEISTIRRYDSPIFAGKVVLFASNLALFAGNLGLFADNSALFVCNMLLFFGNLSRIYGNQAVVGSIYENEKLKADLTAALQKGGKK